MTVAPETATSLALAVVAASQAPLLLLDAEFRVVAVSTSFCRTFGMRRADLVGQKVAELGNGEWNMPQLIALLQAAGAGIASVDDYEMDLTRPGQEARRVCLSVQKLDYFGADAVRLILSVADVTAIRLAEKLKDDLIREKQILLQELQHRVANSLQIIASVIMQSAKRVQSEESRLHLNDAHNRVMSIATMQKQLAASRLGEVDLRSYLQSLCDSIGASMIRDRRRLQLASTADDTRVVADVSVSLGLIVTELVINALKHAFPGPDPEGRIDVDYCADGSAWKLTVGDNGVGMPDIPTKPGLGTGIVEALANQLDATVAVTDQKPGTLVSIVHA